MLKSYGRIVFVMFASDFLLGYDIFINCVRLISKSDSQIDIILYYISK